MLLHILHFIYTMPRSKLCSHMHILQDATRIILHMATLHHHSTQEVLRTGERTTMRSCLWLMPLLLSAAAAAAAASTAMDFIKNFPRTIHIHGLLHTCHGTLTTLLMVLQRWIWCFKLLPFRTTMKRIQVYVCMYISQLRKDYLAWVCVSCVCGAGCFWSRR